MFDTEFADVLAHGYNLVARVGYRGGFELRARTHAAIERIDHDEWVQLIGSRDAREVVVRTETPDSSARVSVLAYDPSLAPQILIREGGLYLGGSYRVVETIDDPTEAEARWTKTTLPGCWVSEPTRRCC